MVSPVSLPQSASATSITGECQAIADYLNVALVLQPPLRVTGQPPLLGIHLPITHLNHIGRLLPQLEQALQTLQGPKYWDVSVYTGGVDSSSPRLIYHCLLEQSPSVPIATTIAPTPDGSPPRGPKAAAVVASSRVPTRLQRQVAQKQRAAKQRQAWMAVMALTSVSFIAGTLVSGKTIERRSPVPFFDPGPNPSAAAPAAARPLEAVIRSPTVDQLVSASGHLTAEAASPLGKLPPLPTETWVQPMAPAQGLTAAANALTVPLSAQVAVQLKAVGDIIPGTDFPDYRLPNDPNYLFNSVKMFMGEVDILFGNFESTLTDYPHSAKAIGQGMTFAFRTPPAFADVLKSAGFDILSVANNHSFDFGDAGFADTIAHLEQAGMRAVGRKDDIVTIPANGYTVAFIGFSYWPDHNNMNDLGAATNLVKTAQAQADMVIISVHAGAEGTDALRVRNQTEYFFSENRGNMVQFSHAMIDAGADLILGHGPHVPRAVELYQDKLIAYSLGNFLGYRTLSTIGALGQSLILQVDLNGDGDFLRGRIVPVALDANGVPYIDDGFNSVTLVRQLTRQDFPATPLTIDQMGYILRADEPQ